MRAAIVSDNTVDSAGHLSENRCRKSIDLLYAIGAVPAFDYGVD